MPLADALGHTGQAQEGLRLLAEALTVLEAGGQGYQLAEAYWLQGVLLQQAIPETAQVEACFQQALAIARRQQAKSWELRAALSLAACGSSRASGRRPRVAGTGLRLVHRGLRHRRSARDQGAAGGTGVTRKAYGLMRWIKKRMYYVHQARRRPHLGGEEIRRHEHGHRRTDPCVTPLIFPLHRSEYGESPGESKTRRE